MRRNIVITEQAVDALFENAADQGEALAGIYKLCLPDWDHIESISGHPSVNNNTWKMLCEKFFAFDKAHHPDCLPGGGWLNRGFSTHCGEKLKDWEVSFKECKFLMAPVVSVKAAS